MLPFLSEHLTQFWGPFRLLSSFLVLIAIGSSLAAILSFFFLPKLWDRLPHDGGKAFVKGSEAAKGKPTGAGVILVNIFTLVILLVLPLHWRFVGIIACLYFCMMTGYLDDKSSTPWGQLKKGLLDAVVVLAAATLLSRGKDVTIWLPIFKGSAPGGGFVIPVAIYIPCAAFLLWISINAVNCSDGVDGLAGSLALMTLFILGIFLYGVTGHKKIAEYFLLPHYTDGAHWATMAFITCGMLAGYLWHNAKPSSVMMGDAGSRFLGLLIGLGSLACGNPFMLLVVAPILLFNGGTGLVKILLLRLLKNLGFDVRQALSRVPNPINPQNFATDEEVEKQIGLVRFIQRYRFPIHDQCRKNLDWSDTQVLVRFMLLQALLTPFLILLFVKLR
ncbi:MAG: hypothetical protein IKP00_11090 [Victivallales bacterium]|nr:hypothetical protein [Victivallales bacterium]